ncbi:MAG TPA: hypothetical protein VIU61_09780 [Kofleriaceae bacterium]
MADDASEPLPPPWVRHPNIPRFSIGWRMGYGESYLDRWWPFAQALDTPALIEYFRSYAPIPVEWVDFVGMALEVPLRDPITAAEVEPSDDWDQRIRRRGEQIAHLGLFDVEAWRAYLEG